MYYLIIYYFWAPGYLYLALPLPVRVRADSTLTRTGKVG